MIGLNTEGRLRRLELQQQWLVEQGSDPATAQYANFAGHRLTVLAEPGGGYARHYLGYAQPCASIDEGKAGAGMFARAVLDLMKSEIVD